MAIARRFVLTNASRAKNVPTIAYVMTALKLALLENRYILSNNLSPSVRLSVCLSVFIRKSVAAAFSGLQTAGVCDYICQRIVRMSLICFPVITYPSP